MHGVPTSSYVWRKIFPYLAGLGRCIAPDLIGFGRSGKPNIEYSIDDHIKYVEEFISVLGLKNITLVMHGLGSVIGLNYAMHHENNCSGLVFYESFLRNDSSGELSLPFQEQLATLNDLESASDKAANGVAFVDRIIQQSLMHELPAEDMANYRQPFMPLGAGKPILQYLKELPKGDGSSKMEQLIKNYSTQLTKSRLPKLLLYSVPGFITTIATIKWAKDNLSNLEIVDIGEELHLGQESCAELFGETISAWMQANV